MFGKLAKQTDDCMLEQSLVALDEWTPAEPLARSFDRQIVGLMADHQRKSNQPAVRLPGSQREAV